MGIEFSPAKWRSSRSAAQQRVYSQRCCNTHLRLIRRVNLGYLFFSHTRANGPNYRRSGFGLAGRKGGLSVLNVTTFLTHRLHALYPSQPCEGDAVSSLYR